MMIVTLFAYLRCLRLSGVLEGVTSVGRKCSSIVGEDLSVTYVCWSVTIVNKPVQDCGFFLFRTGNPALCVVVVVLLVPACSHCLLFPVFCVCSQVVSLFCLCFLLLFFVLFFPLASQAQFVLAGWGAALLQEGYPEWSLASNVAEDLLCFPVLSFVTVGHWVIRRPQNGSEEGLLKLLLYRSPEFVTLARPTVHSAQ